MGGRERAEGRRERGGSRSPVSMALEEALALAAACGHVQTSFCTDTNAQVPLLAPLARSLAPLPVV
eukprot:2039474-Rhodomonas_salina.1